MTRVDRSGLAAVLLAAACSSDRDDGPTGPTTAACETTSAAIAVSLHTDDDLRLEADFYPSGEVGGDAVILLHMVPPANDKSNFPTPFIDGLRIAGFSVLNVNRRGAGHSEGDPGEAYQGPSGRLDAVAAHAFLVDSGCEAPPGSIAIVGASNGTTTALDFTVEAPAGDRPPAMAWMSPGSYTENQHAIADVASIVAPIPIFFGYTDAEQAWAEGVEAQSAGRWELHAYAGGKHGAGLFTSNPEIADQIAMFLDEHRASD